MKSPISSPAFLLFALTGLATADVPEKPPAAKYSGLYTNSPFTSKPVIEPHQEGKVFDDYSLLGVSAIGGTGYRVTLINKKQPDERIIVDSDSSKSGFKILSVIRKPGDPQGTVVRMSSGSMAGTVSFDKNLLTIAATTAKRANLSPGGMIAGKHGTPASLPPPRHPAAATPRPINRSAP